MLRSAAFCLSIVLVAGCRRGGPDENYQQASALYQQLYATQLDDAYGDPKMDEVVALLRKVSPRSSDAYAAQTLLGTIQRGRDELAKERAEREKMAVAAVRSTSTGPVNIDTSKLYAATEQDAGGPPEDPFAPGASVAELNKQSGGCLVDNEPFTEQGTGVGGTVYRVAPSETCRSKLPGLIGQVVLVVNGKIYRRTADPRPPPSPAAQDAGTPQKAAAAPKPKPATASAADAGEPQYYISVPGLPQPGYTPPPEEQQR